MASDLEELKYCNNLFTYSRFKTNVVNVGSIPLGGDHPIRIQSMTNTPTCDTKATVDQIVSLADAGCDYVRMTTRNIKEAIHLKTIKKELKIRGYNVPLIADVHFNPDIAIEAARIAEKVRINPGNYADIRNPDKTHYSEQEYKDEVDKISHRLKSLIDVCKEYGTAIRIGTNHGSLSNRIMSRYGDTPEGMVESSMEFIRICESFGFRNIVVSMKASNILVMIQAYRLLVNNMMKAHMNYPLHLGVTEAGDGLDGRVKSAAGIGALLGDGLGDTIRVSLTEDPVNEIPVAKALALRYQDRKDSEPNEYQLIIDVNPFNFKKRTTNPKKNIGGNNPPVVILDNYPENTFDIKAEIPDYFASVENNHYELIPFSKSSKGKFRLQAESSIKFPVFSFDEYMSSNNKSAEVNFIRISIDDQFKERIEKLHNDKTIVLVLESNTLDVIGEFRQFFTLLNSLNSDLPVILKIDYSKLPELEMNLFSAADLSAILVDGLGDGIWVSNKNEKSQQDLIKLSFAILQATRSRITKTEYIACPSCGRTHFNISEILQKIRLRTNHLKGLKIGVMGCIVNGPGEMADADYGYVGSGPGKVTLYKKKQVIEKNIPAKDAVEKLLSLIKKYGEWKDPED